MSHVAYQQIPYYAQDVDFDDLSKRDADWAAICKSAKESKRIDFQDPNVVLYRVSLTKDMDILLT